MENLNLLELSILKGIKYEYIQKGEYDNKKNTINYKTKNIINANNKNINLDVVIVKIFLALNYLHINNIIHNDIRINSIFDDGILGNFKKSCPVYLSKHFINFNQYSAPEVLDNNIFIQSDLWSLGCLLFELEQKIPLFRVQGDNDKELYKLSQIEFLKQIGNYSQYKKSEKHINLPNLIQYNKIFINWTKKWTVFAMKHFFQYLPNHRTNLADILILPEIQEIINLNNLNTNYTELKIININGNYQDSLNFWYEYYNFENNELINKISLKLYHILNTSNIFNSTLDNCVSKKDKILLIYYITCKIIKKSIDLDSKTIDKITYLYTLLFSSSSIDNLSILLN